MTRKIALLLVLAMIVALFAGCNNAPAGNTGAPAQQEQTDSTPPSNSNTGSGSSGSSSSGSSNTGSSSGSNGSGSSSSGSAGTDNGNAGSESSTEPVEEPSPYKFAKGKFATDERGISTQPYTYEMPLTTTDEIFTMWTTIYTPQYIPEEGYGSLPLPTYDRELTGVNVEYEIIETSNRQSNFSVLRAADDFRDIMTNGAVYYGGVDTDILTEGYFVNLYDYRDYLPNYMYLVKYFDPTDVDTYDKVFLSEDQVASMWVLYANPVINGSHIVRKDWVDAAGINLDDIVTFDDLVELCKLMRTEHPECQYPFMLINTLEQKPVYDFSPAFGTLAYVSASALCPNFLVDGKVTFANMNETDRNLVRALNGVFAEDLITPNWMGWGFGNDYAPMAHSGELFYWFASCADIVTSKYANVDPDCEWVPINNPLEYKDQVLHVASDRTRLLTSCCFNISSKCENVELVSTWCDWFFSVEGGDLWSYGLEGHTWEYDDNGNRIATELVTNNPDGMSVTWALSLYAGYVGAVALNFYNKRNFMDPKDGAAAWNVAEYIYTFNDQHYDKAGHFPTGARLSESETAAVNDVSGDVMTFMAETYLAFISGEKNVETEWDAYVSELRSLGMDTIIDCYQAAYDRYLAANG